MIKVDFKLPEVGQYISFPGRTMQIYGYVIKIDNESCIYVRDNLTKWDCSLLFLEFHSLLSQEEFIEIVQENASRSKQRIPSIQQVKDALNYYLNNETADAITVSKLFDL